MSGWTQDSNDRRCELIDKEIDGTITTEEARELEGLQLELMMYRRMVAPLPISRAKRLLKKLLKKLPFIETELFTEDEQWMLENPELLKELSDALVRASNKEFSEHSPEDFITVNE